MRLKPPSRTVTRKAAVAKPNGLLPETIRNKLRSLVAPVGHKGSWMQHLTDLQLSEIYLMLRSGKPATHVVKYVQESWNIMTGAKINNLTVAVINFRREALGDIYDLPEETFEKSRSDALSKLETYRKSGRDIVKKLDAVAAMADLVALEQTRLEIRFQNEQVNGTPDKALSKDISTYATLLTSLVDMQVKTGILDYKVQPTAILHQHSFNGSLAALPDGGSRLAVAGDVFLKRLSELPARQLTQLPDGTYGVADDSK